MTIPQNVVNDIVRILAYYNDQNLPKSISLSDRIAFVARSHKCKTEEIAAFIKSCGCMIPKSFENILSKKGEMEMENTGIDILGSDPKELEKIFNGAEASPLDELGTYYCKPEWERYKFLIELGEKYKMLPKEVAFMFYKEGAHVPKKFENYCILASQGKKRNRKVTKEASEEKPFGVTDYIEKAIAQAKKEAEEAKKMYEKKNSVLEQLLSLRKGIVNGVD